MTKSQDKTFTLRYILEKEMLNDSNFFGWYQNLRTVLRQERKCYVLEKALPEKLPSNASHAVRNNWHMHYDDVVEVRRLMLANMASDMRKQFEDVESPIEMIAALKRKFQGQARIERFKTVKSLVQCKLPQGVSVGSHVKRMMSHFENMARLDSPIGHELATDIILQSLPSSFDLFVKCYYSKNLMRPLTELHDMLVTFEYEIKKIVVPVPKVRGGNRFVKPGKDCGRGETDPIDNRGKSGSVAKSETDASDVKKCRYCNKSGHWRSECEKFLKDYNEIEEMYGISLSGIMLTQHQAAVERWKGKQVNLCPRMSKELLHWA